MISYNSQLLKMSRLLVCMSSFFPSCSCVFPPPKIVVGNYTAPYLAGAQGLAKRDRVWVMTQSWLSQLYLIKNTVEICDSLSFS